MTSFHNYKYKLKIYKNMNKIIKTLVTFLGLCLVFVFTVNGVFAMTPLQQKDSVAKASYDNTKKQYTKELTFYKNARQNFKNARSKFNQVKNAKNKTEYVASAKEYLKTVINVFISKLETVKKWVSNNPAIADADKTKIISEIDADISWLKSELGSIDTATLSQIKEKAKEIREYWRNHKSTIKRIVGQIHAARINFMIDKAEDFSEKISLKIEELKNAGIDTTELEKMLNDFNEKISLAKEKYELAKEKFNSISTVTGADALFAEGDKFVKDANTYIRDAHKLLKQIAVEMRHSVNSDES